jgi:transposase
MPRIYHPPVKNSSFSGKILKNFPKALRERRRGGKRKKKPLTKALRHRGKKKRGRVGERREGGASSS